MADKRYTSIFLPHKTRDIVKERAVKLGYPSMIDFIEALNKVSIEKLREILK